MADPKSEIIFEDDHLIAVNKAPGDLAIPDRHQPGLFNLQSWLNDRYGRVWTVHRLDRDTSGIICFAKTAGAHRHLSLQFENRNVEKTYLALVDGTPFPREGEIDQPITAHPSHAGKMMVSRNGKPALTRYRTTEIFRLFSLLETNIYTGRTHQIRVHLAYLGHPLAIDPLYGKREAFFLSEVKGKKYRMGKDQPERPLMTRTTLHAWRLGLRHPATEAPTELSAPLHKDFSAVLRHLRKWGKDV